MRQRAAGVSSRSADSAPHALDLPSRAALRRAPLGAERLTLTPIELSDAPALWEVINASRDHLGRWLPWVPFNTSLDATELYTDACVTDWDAGRAARFGIRARGSGALLGVVALDACVHLHRSCELGYWLRQDATGRGLMTEAARGALEFAFQRMGTHRVRCAAATGNHASLRVIAKLALRFEGIARHAEYVDHRWVDHAVFARLSTDT